MGVFNPLFDQRGRRLRRLRRRHRRLGLLRLDHPALPADRRGGARAHRDHQLHRRLPGAREAQGARTCSSPSCCCSSATSSCSATRRGAWGRRGALRSFGRRGMGWRVYGQMLGQLLLRTFARAQRIYLAMKCRGFDGQVRVARQAALPGGRPRLHARLVGRVRRRSALVDVPLAARAASSPGDRERRDEPPHHQRPRPRLRLSGRDAGAGRRLLRGRSRRGDRRRRRQRRRQVDAAAAPQRAAHAGARDASTSAASR